MIDKTIPKWFNQQIILKSTCKYITFSKSVFAIKRMQVVLNSMSFFIQITLHVQLIISPQYVIASEILITLYNY